MITITEVLPFTMNKIGKVRWFEVRIKFSDNQTKRWDMSMKQLNDLGCPVTQLSETKKLKDWVLGNGRSFFENQVNTIFVDSKCLIKGEQTNVISNS